MIYSHDDLATLQKKKDYRNECSKISARSASDVQGYWHEESLMRAFYYTPSTLFKTWRIWTILIRTLAEATWDAFLPTFTHGLNKIAYQDKTNAWCVFIFLFLLQKIITCKIMFNWNDCMLKVYDFLFLVFWFYLVCVLCILCVKCPENLKINPSCDF